MAVAYAVGQDSHKFGGRRATVSQRTARECLSASSRRVRRSQGSGETRAPHALCVTKYYAWASELFGGLVVRAHLVPAHA